MADKFENTPVYPILQALYPTDIPVEYNNASKSLVFHVCNDIVVNICGWSGPEGEFVMERRAYPFSDEGTYTFMSKDDVISYITRSYDD